MKTKGTRYKPTLERKTVRMMIRLTPKNALYLSKLGYIDLRSGKVKNNGSEFANNCITSVCESRTTGEVPQARSDELLEAWTRAQIAELNAVVEEANAKIIAHKKRIHAMRAETINI